MEPNEISGKELVHSLIHAYDPVKAHDYYERTKLLKGRNREKPPEIQKAKTTKNWTNDGYQETYDTQVANLKGKLERLRMQIHSLLSRNVKDEGSIALNEEFLKKATQAKMNLHAAAARARAASNQGTA